MSTTTTAQANIAFCTTRARCVQPDNSGPHATVATSIDRIPYITDGPVTCKDYVEMEARAQGLLEGMSLMDKTLHTINFEHHYVEVKTTIYQN